MTIELKRWHVFFWKLGRLYDLARKSSGLLRDPIIACSTCLIVGLGIGLWEGASIAGRVQLSVLSQLRARDIMVAVHRKCDEKFVKPLEGGPFGLIELAGARCAVVSDEALEEMYRVGVSPVDEVLERAQAIAREKKMDF